MCVGALGGRRRQRRRRAREFTVVILTLGKKGGTRFESELQGIFEGKEEEGGGGGVCLVSLPLVHTLFLFPCAATGKTYYSPPEERRGKREE